MVFGEKDRSENGNSPQSDLCIFLTQVLSSHLSKPSLEFLLSTTFLAIGAVMNEKQGPLRISFKVLQNDEGDCCSYTWINWNLVLQVILYLKIDRLQQFANTHMIGKILVPFGKCHAIGNAKIGDKLKFRGPYRFEIIGD